MKRVAKKLEFISQDCNWYFLLKNEEVQETQNSIAKFNIKKFKSFDDKEFYIVFGNGKQIELTPVKLKRVKDISMGMSEAIKYIKKHHIGFVCICKTILSTKINNKFTKVLQQINTYKAKIKTLK